MAPIGMKLWENPFQTIPDIQFFHALKKFFGDFLFSKLMSGWFVFQESGVLEELWFFGRDGQMRLDKWPPKFWLSALYDFSQRGKSGTYRFWSGFWTEKDFNHLVLWCYDHVIWRYYVCSRGCGTKLWVAPAKLLWRQQTTRSHMSSGQNTYGRVYFV